MYLRTLIAAQSFKTVSVMIKFANVKIAVKILNLVIKTYHVA